MKLRYEATIKIMTEEEVCDSDIEGADMEDLKTQVDNSIKKMCLMEVWKANLFE